MTTTVEKNDSKIKTNVKDIISKPSEILKILNLKVQVNTESKLAYNEDEEKKSIKKTKATRFINEIVKRLSEKRLSVNHIRQILPTWKYLKTVPSTRKEKTEFYRKSKDALGNPFFVGNTMSPSVIQRSVVVPCLVDYNGLEFIASFYVKKQKNDDLYVKGNITKDMLIPFSITDLNTIYKNVLWETLATTVINFHHVPLQEYNYNDPISKETNTYYLPVVDPRYIANQVMKSREMVQADANTKNTQKNPDDKKKKSSQKSIEKNEQNKNSKELHTKTKKNTKTFVDPVLLKTLGITDSHQLFDITSTFFQESRNASLPNIAKNILDVFLPEKCMTEEQKQQIINDCICFDKTKDERSDNISPYYILKAMIVAFHTELLIPAAIDKRLNDTNADVISDFDNSLFAEFFGKKKGSKKQLMDWEPFVSYLPYAVIYFSEMGKMFTENVTNK